MSMRKAINDMCKDCIYDEYEPGTWRAQVEACPCTECPLYQYRPKTTKRATTTTSPNPTNT